MAKSKQIAIGYAAAAVLAGMAAPAAHASVVELSGAGAGEGLTLSPSNVIDAIYANGTGVSSSTAYTVQGVTFAAATTETSVLSWTGGPGGGILTPSSPNDSPTNSFNNSTVNNGFTEGYVGGDTTNTSDAPLTAMMNSGLFFNTDDNSLTVSGLQPSTTYVVNLLYSLTNLSYSTRLETVTFASTGVSEAAFEPANYQIYASTDTITTGPSATTITANFGDTSQTYVNAIVVSTVPEPASIGLLGSACAGLFLKRRRRT